MASHEHIHELFLMSDNLELRSTVLWTHVFSDKTIDLNTLETPFFMDVFRHVVQSGQAWVDAFVQASHAMAQFEKRCPNTCRLVGWFPDNNAYPTWMQFALDLGVARPEYQEELMALFNQWFDLRSQAASPGVSSWLDHAEWWLENGKTVKHEWLLTHLSLRFPKSLDVSIYLLPFKALHAQWLSPVHDNDTLLWLTETPSAQKMQWCANNHPRLDAWTLMDKAIADYGTLGETSELLMKKSQTLMNSTKDSALFKAWYGIELDYEEAQKYPQAQSLYVHKHAPALLEEVQPLSSVWALALEVAVTGSQFRQMLIASGKNTQVPEEMDLLDLPLGI